MTKISRAATARRLAGHGGGLGAGAGRDCGRRHRAHGRRRPGRPRPGRSPLGSWPGSSNRTANWGTTPPHQMAPANALCRAWESHESWPTGQAQLKPKSLLRARVRKADHTAGESRSIRPSGFPESRTSTEPSTTATSTQPSVSDALLFRQTMNGFSKLATRPLPTVRQASVGIRVADGDECPASLREHR